MSINVPIPVPTNFLEWAWFGIGINFGRAFGKQFDQSVQRTDWFKRRQKWQQWIIKRLLDATHHWWIGALLMIYGVNIVEVVWFGAGLFVDDLPDVPRRAKEILNELKNH